MFVASDVVDEEISEDGSTHRIERRCALDVDAPRLLKRVNYRSDRRLMWITSAVHCGYCDFWQLILSLFILAPGTVVYEAATLCLILGVSCQFS